MNVPPGEDEAGGEKSGLQVDRVVREDQRRGLKNCTHAGGGVDDDEESILVPLAGWHTFPRPT